MLFTPFAIGPLTLKNRLVALPVFTGYALPDGRVSDLLIGHYASLAESGVAMVVVANASVSADGVVAVNNLRIDRDDFIPALARLARAIQQRGALAVLQLNHGGRFAKTGQPLSPSALDTAHIPFNIASLKDFMNFLPLAEALDFAARLEAEGVSYFSPSVGTYQSMFTPDVRAVMSRLAYLRDDALALKKRVCRPVIVSGRVQTPALAEQLLAEGAGDLIGLGRVLSVDPEWVVGDILRELRAGGHGTL